MPISINIEEKEKKRGNKGFKLFKKKDSSLQAPNVPSGKKNLNWKKVAVLFATAIVLGLFVYGGIQLYGILKSIGVNLSVSELISSEEVVELKKNSSGKYTSFMMVGIDTREDSGGLNTDTIIVVTYNYNTKDITMISVPRDTGVEIEGAEGTWYGKINSVYAYSTSENKLDSLKSTVEEVTGIEIQYYAMVNYEGFVEIIDTLGGINVNVEESFTDNCYPSEKGAAGSYYAYCVDSYGWWKTVSFEKGTQLMDGETALEYSRSRHSSTDFVRAKRQQAVIEAVKDALFSSETYTSPQKIFDLITAVSDNLTLSEFTLNDIKAGMKLLNTYQENNGKSFSFVLDPSSGNGNLVSNYSSIYGYYIIGPAEGMGKYTNIHEYISLILANPGLYEEKSKIYVYDTGLGYQKSYDKVQSMIENYPYLDITYQGTLYSDKKRTIVYENETGKKPYTQEEISSYLDADTLMKPEYITNNLNGEDIVVLLGEPITQETEVENE
jgi:LCP family protein required for cell wall assembly